MSLDGGQKAARRDGGGPLAGLGGEDGLARLLREAERHQIDVAQDSKLRLAVVLARYAEAGLSFADAEEAGVVLAGVLARSSRDETALRQLVRAAWHARSAPPGGAGDGAAKPEAPPAAARRTARMARNRQAALLAGAAAVAGGLTLAIWWLQAGGNAPTTAFIAATGPFRREPDVVFADLMLRLAMALPFLLAAWLLWERRRTDAAPDATPAPGSIVQALPNAGELPLFANLAARRAVERLRRPLRIRSRRFDAPGSVRATAGAGGVPSLRFEEKRVALECVVLIERAGRTDHVAALGVRLCGLLREAGAQVARYEFAGTPALVTRVEDAGGGAGAPLAFDRFAAAHARARLLLVGSGNAFLNPRMQALGKPYREALDAFAQVYLLSPAPRRPAGAAQPGMRHGGAGEAAFRAAMAEHAFGLAGAQVVAADTAGLVAAAASALAPLGDSGEAAATADLPDRLVMALDARLPLYLAEHPLPPAPDNGADAPLATCELPEAEVSELVSALRGHMGSRPAFRLLAAVLIYPRLHPDLTCAIAEALAAHAPVGRRGAMEPVGPPLTDDLYLRIARLPWGRETKAPAWLRFALARALTDAERAAVVRALDAVTESLVPLLEAGDPERVVLAPDDGARIGHPTGVPAADPVFAAFRRTEAPLHISVLAPRTAAGQDRAPVSAGRGALIALLAGLGAAAYLFAKTSAAILAPAIEMLRDAAARFFGAIIALLPSVLDTNVEAAICLALALLLGLVWLLFPDRIVLSSRIYREPDVGAIDRFVTDATETATPKATRWLNEAANSLRPQHRSKVK